MTLISTHQPAGTTLLHHLTTIDSPSPAYQLIISYVLSILSLLESQESENGDGSHESRPAWSHTKVYIIFAVSRCLCESFPCYCTHSLDRHFPLLLSLPLYPLSPSLSIHRKPLLVLFVIFITHAHSTTITFPSCLLSFFVCESYDHDFLVCTPPLT